MAYIDITEQFCAGPEKFMEENVVMQWIQRDSADVFGVGVKMIENAVVSNKPNGKVCFFYEKTTTPSLPAYWCPYSQNQFKSSMLGNDALFAFTPGVTGCSVGIGSGSGGSQMMCHVNSAQVGLDWKGTGQSADRQAQSQDAQLKYKLGNDLSIASPLDYRSADNAVILTVFAVHGLSLPWQLKSLSYKKLGPTRYFHAGVRNY
ncbi:MAG: hypothetical protein KUG82_14325 [Pseudomonadales bacterium]|nr:hypothetical protein [Pseudomonadales bacterium]